RRHGAGHEECELSPHFHVRLLSIQVGASNEAQPACSSRRCRRRSQTGKPAAASRQLRVGRPERTTLVPGPGLAPELRANTVATSPVVSGGVCVSSLERTLVPGPGLAPELRTNSVATSPASRAASALCPSSPYRRRSSRRCASRRPAPPS